MPCSKYHLTSLQHANFSSALEVRLPFFFERSSPERLDDSYFPQRSCRPLKDPRTAQAFSLLGPTAAAAFAQSG